jgi:pre-mRNA-processing factor 19
LNLRLSKSRRKRPVPKDWASSEDIESYDVISTSDLLYPGSSSIAIDGLGERVIIGGSDGIAGIYSLSDHKILTAHKVGGGAITDAVWYGNKPIISTSSGVVKVFDGGQEAATFTSHAGAVNALAMHPSGEILASVGADQSFVFYDLVAAKPVTQVYTDCGPYLITKHCIHPLTLLRSNIRLVPSRWSPFCSWWYRWSS